jgi:hypothetical protein
VVGQARWCSIEKSFLVGIAQSGGQAIWKSKKDGRMISEGDFVEI